MDSSVPALSSQAVKVKAPVPVSAMPQKTKPGILESSSADVGFTFLDLADQFTGIGVQAYNCVRHPMPSPRQKDGSVYMRRAYTAYKDLVWIMVGGVTTRSASCW